MSFPALSLRLRPSPSFQLYSFLKHPSTSPACQQVRYNSKNVQAQKKQRDAEKSKKKKKQRSEYLDPDLAKLEQFNLCDAMRYLRAFEVGRPPSSAKYDLAVRLKTTKSGPVVRNRLRLPHPVRTDLRVCVIVPADSPDGKRAKAAGAAVVGTDEVFEAVKAGKIDFDRCIAHEDYVKDLQKAGVARILGPRRLMPSVKEKTVTKDVVNAVKDMVSASEYRERVGIIRMAIGQLGFTPEQVSENIKAVMGSIKKDAVTLSESITKEIKEVVLSSTHGPGLSLTGKFSHPDGTDPTTLSVAS